MLDEDWSSSGAYEAANLLHDLAAALGFTHGRGLVHGDVKPDNIGFERERYILLDFGICRPQETFADASAASGEWLVRAPELLAGEANTAASDVWALGATVLNAVAGRYPFAQRGEMPGRDHQRQREAFKRVLAERSAAGGSELELQALLRDSVSHVGLRRVLGKVLMHEPEARPPADELARLCRRELSALIRGSNHPAGMSPSQRLDQLNRFLPPSGSTVRSPAFASLALSVRTCTLGLGGESGVESGDVVGGGT